MKINRKITFGLIVVLIICFAINALSCGTPKVSVGDKAPDFTLNTVDSKPLSLSSYKGTPILLIFDMVACPPCDEQRIFIKNAIKSFNSKIVILSVYCGTGELAQIVGANNTVIATMKSYTNERKISDYDISLFDRDNLVQQNKYGFSGSPISILIDSNGVIKAIKIGQFTNEIEISDWLTKLQ